MAQESLNNYHTANYSQGPASPLPPVCSLQSALPLTTAHGTAKRSMAVVEAGRDAQRASGWAPALLPPTLPQPRERQLAPSPRPSTGLTSPWTHAEGLCAEAAFC